MLIDSHAHLDYEYEEPIDTLLNNAAARGVDRVISIAASADSLDRVKQIAEKFSNVYFTSGIHPHDAKDFSPEIFAKIQNLAQHPKCVAIGELGLDYFYNLSDREGQKHALQIQLDFSVQIAKPIVLHTRDAEEDTIQILSSHAKKFPSHRSPGVIHCFTGSKKLAEAALQLGYYISFSGIITFKNADALREIVKDIVPLNKILVETDSPYLTPVPFRGKKNQPAYTRFVAQKVAELKQESLEKVAEITSQNAVNLFALP